ncbi:hypothetical protein POREN0001_0737 [Porphyromonas endodontalis ATCC 35406]|uniref:Uncharacterized protein n=1 Tax=Porphyromonas endodontalis (strain ATCC 35406 / DSM 24491 / JCM 8526 / CCUG 16442 / BCRC 14492 / NCTC 13058 / HG 370) TaxID=553175 RepID=C3J9I6_POREA|nr:hypothetical protein POREN0001_0737 [Porphyromonas endodontalis ATCC 35406]
MFVIILFYFILSKGAPIKGSHIDRSGYLIPYSHGNISPQKEGASCPQKSTARKFTTI